MQRRRLVVAGVGLLTAVALSTWVAPATVQADPPVARDAGVSVDSAVVIVGASAADDTLVADALSAFSAAGLEVPPLEIRFAATEADCRGHLGLFEHRAIRSRIHICEAKNFVVTHEIAHVWVAVNLDQEQREHYMRVRGLDNWNDWDAAWTERGIEDAAFVMQQNLTMDRVPLSSATWVERIEAFEILTGQPSPLRARSRGSVAPTPRGPITGEGGPVLLAELSPRCSHTPGGRHVLLGPRIDCHLP